MTTRTDLMGVNAALRAENARLRKELATANHRLEVDRNLDLKYLVAEQARQEAVRSAENERGIAQKYEDRYFALKCECDDAVAMMKRSQGRETTLKSRLSRAESVLAHFDAKLTRNYWHDEVLYCGECGCAISACESHTVTCDRGRIRAALQPEGEPK